MRSQVIFFVVILILLSLTVLILIIPQAEVIITLNQKTIKQSYAAKLSTTINYPITSLGLIPGSRQKISLDQPAESWTFKNQDILNYARDRLDREIKSPDHLLANSLSFSVEIEDTVTGKIRIYVDGIVVTDIEMVTLERELVGRRLPEAVAYLKNLPPVKEVEIKQKPLPLPYLPLLKSRIKISVNAR